MCGLCHGHYGYAGVARTLGLDPDEVTWQAPGLNHNIWLTDFIYDNEDMYPKLDRWDCGRERGVLGTVGPRGQGDSPLRCRVRRFINTRCMA